MEGGTQAEIPSSTTQRDRPVPERLARLATSASVAVLAGTSALQMLLFLRLFGTSEATDGTLAAYSLYVLVTVFAQGARISGGAAIAGKTPRVQPRDLAWALGAVAIAFPVLLWLAKAPVSHLVATGAPAQAAAEQALPVLGLGMTAQFAAVAWATILGARGQLTLAAVSLACGGAAALLAFVLLAPSQDQAALAWATVVSGTSACLIMAMRVRFSVERLRVRHSLQVLRLLLAENLVPMFSTTVYVIAVAVAAQVANEPGEVSLFALAFLASSYLCGILGTANAIVDTVELAGGESPFPERLGVVVRRGARSTFAPSALVMCAAAASAPALVVALAPDQTGQADPRWLAAYLIALLPFTFATLATNLGFSAWFTSGEVRKLNRAIVITLLAHVMISGGLGSVLGVLGVALSTGATTVLFAAHALRPADELGRWVASAAVREGLIAAVVFVPLWALLANGRPSLASSLFVTLTGSAILAVRLLRTLTAARGSRASNTAAHD